MTIFHGTQLVRPVELAHTRDAQHHVKRLVHQVVKEVLAAGFTEMQVGYRVIGHNELDAAEVAGIDPDVNGFEYATVREGGLVVRAWATVRPA